MTDHSMDGIDPDVVPDEKARRAENGRWCRQAAEDLKELESMSEADKNRYSGTPRLSKKSKPRGGNGYR